MIRGEDANPHQVSFREARVVRIGGGPGQPIAMKEAVIHAPPHQDVFLPFEFSITDLGSGWYGLEADSRKLTVVSTNPTSAIADG